MAKLTIVITDDTTGGYVLKVEGQFRFAFHEIERLLILVQTYLVDATSEHGRASEMEHHDARRNLRNLL